MKVKDAVVDEKGNLDIYIKDAGGRTIRCSTSIDDCDTEMIDNG